MDLAVVNARAQALLRTCTLAIRQDGPEIVELLDAGVPHHTVASLYPYASSAWQAGWERMILTGPVPRKIISLDSRSSEVRMVRPQRRLVALSEESSAAAQWLAKRLPLSSSEFSDTDRQTYAAYARYISIGGPDPFLHVNMLTMLLHVLAASPETMRTLEDPEEGLRHAAEVLNAAQMLTEDPAFWPAPPQPSSD
jgi:hypothetical protein